MRLTIEQFTRLFPRSPFRLSYVERGEHKNRKFIWYAAFTSDYFTSDSDRLVDDHCPPRGYPNPYTDASGNTPEEALSELARQVLENMKASVESRKKYRREAEEALESFQKQLEKVL